MTVSPIQAISAYRPVQPVKRQDKHDASPPVKEKDSSPPPEQHAKKKHKVDVTV